MKITLIAGARPNFIKIAPIIAAIEAAAAGGRNISYRLVHTGQHYDKNMSDSFFLELGIPEPHANLGCGGGTQAEQTANIMVRFEQELFENPCDLVLVVGDVTSTLACSIVAKKLCIKVAHVEGGIRSGDMTMPEEINRIVTDSISDYFFTTSEVANANLLAAGVAEARIFFVGNTMIDTLLRHKAGFIKPELWDELDLKQGAYFMLTLHRPANVDEPRQLLRLIENICTAAQGLPVIFPVHPRTAGVLSRLAFDAPNLHTVPPLSYLRFNYLVAHAKCVITDSGGITEETTVMGVPCITLRNSTERPETVTIGTNELIGTSPDALPPYLESVMRGEWKQGAIPPMWDGHTAPRIIDALLKIHNQRPEQHPQPA